ncbi:hypothetical protein NQ318_005741 [Aromia moschata]|uniref:Uncharacterized protein n=1 Tax=Aromia moschata TaxID=1265417 RepID=A0AAV8YRU4_9CUCU|nr:hypothetical protein NQ318_005741 [Aromia moschata]
MDSTRFESVKAVKAKATEVQNQLTEADFQHCFQQWKSRMARCRDHQGEYIEGEKVATKKCTGMDVYPAHKFLNGLNGLKRDMKRQKTIRAPEGPQHQKQTKTLIREDRRLSIRGLAEITGIDKECNSSLTPEQKESRMNICADILNNIDTDPGLLDTVITCDDKIRKCGSG